MLNVDDATLVRRFFLVIAASIILYISGFIYFTYTANRMETELPESSNSLVVVFTGAKGRINKGFEVAHDLSTTLLISGVHEETSLSAILSYNEVDPTVADKVDVILGRMAQNTYENAIESDICATTRSFDSIIVVTSNYHLPRASAMMSIVSDHPVYYIAESSKRLGLVSFMKKPSNLPLVLREYHKYLRLKLYYILHHYFKLFNVNDGTHEYFRRL